MISIGFWNKERYVVSTKVQIDDSFIILLAENEFSRLKREIMGKDTLAISAYLKWSVRKSEVMRTQEHIRIVKNGANSNSVKTCAPMPNKASEF